MMLDAVKTGSWLTRERLSVYPVIFAIIGMAGLFFVWFTGATALTDRFGKPIGTDFSGVWTAGRMLLAGDLTGPFDPHKHVAFQREVFASPGIDVYGWHYPPFFLAVAALIALLPYLPALLVWQAATFAVFAATLRAIVPGHGLLVTLVAIGFPASLLTFAHGHNAFLSAALLGGGLLMLGRRPLLAGVLIGLLAYKPQFGVVLPLVLALGGHWRAIAAAAATVAAMAALSTLACGPEVWGAFLKGAVFTREVVLEQGATGWYKIQSVFSAVRSMGGSLALAYGVQAIATSAVLLGLATVVVARADHRLVAAATAIGALLATPYCLDYDMAILGVAIAFATAHAIEKGFVPYEISLLAAVWLMPFLARPVMQATGLPIGVVTMVVFFAAIVVRAMAGRPNFLSFPFWSLARGTRA